MIFALEQKSGSNFGLPNPHSPAKGITMKASEFLPKNMKLFRVRVKIKQVGHTQMIDTTITAPNANLARRLVKDQFGHTALVGNVQEVK